jgi:type IX secretion system PorP/SprF family membrane protein
MRSNFLDTSKTIIFSLLLLTVISQNKITAQQETQFTQYFQNPFFFNPAAGGLTPFIQVDAGFRRQWLGIEGTPITFYATGHAEVGFLNGKKDVIQEFNREKESIFATPKNLVGGAKHVMGGRMLSDRIGPFEKSSVMATYAYHLRATRTTMLGLGMGAGWTNFGIRSDKVILYDEDDIAYNDFFARNANQNIFDMNAGLTWYGERFQVGIASSQLLSNGLVLEEVTTQSNLDRHWFLYGMYQYDVNDDFTLEPHAMLQIVGNAPVSANLGARVIFNQRIWGNIGFRVGDAMTLGLGMNLANNLRFGYTYDVGTGPVQVMSNNVHELHLGFIIGNNRNIEKELKQKESDL